MNNKLTVSASPHFHCGENTTGLMADVLLALLPAVVMSVILFGRHSLVLIVISVAACMGFEYATRRLLHRSNSLADLSAVVTGVLLAMNPPSTAPWWLPIIGAFVAIVVVKQFFGGIGQNFVNPALVGRITLMVSFPQYMTAMPWKIPTVDGVTSATPLSLMANGEIPSLAEMFTKPTAYDPFSMFLGLRPGSLGETCIAALLLGGVYLCVRKVISPAIPLLFMGTTVAITWVFGQNPYYNLMSGGLVLGAVFMATDYTTCPINRKGKWVYAVGCGVITAVIRLWGGMPEGVSIAIVLMNILVPRIERLTTPKPFGYVKEKKSKEGAQ